MSRGPAHAVLGVLVAEPGGWMSPARRWAERLAAARMRVAALLGGPELPGVDVDLLVDPLAGSALDARVAAIPAQPEASGPRPGLHAMDGRRRARDRRGASRLVRQAAATTGARTTPNGDHGGSDGRPAPATARGFRTVDRAAKRVSHAAARDHAAGPADRRGGGRAAAVAARLAAIAERADRAAPDNRARLGGDRPVTVGRPTVAPDDRVAARDDRAVLDRGRAAATGDHPARQVGLLARAAATRWDRPAANGDRPSAHAGRAATGASRPAPPGRRGRRAAPAITLRRSADAALAPAAAPTRLVHLLADSVAGLEAIEGRLSRLAAPEPELGDAPRGVRWLEDDELADRLQRILRRQALAHGIDLS